MKVLTAFIDTVGNGKGEGVGVIYDPNGDNKKSFTSFPIEGISVSKDRIKLLASDQNKIGKPLIEINEQEKLTEEQTVKEDLPVQEITGETATTKKSKK